MCDQQGLCQPRALLQQAGLLSRRQVEIENSNNADSVTVTILICRLPFDEAQLEIPDNDKTDPFEKQPQGFINNNPAKNNPNAKPKAKSGGGGGAKDRGGRRQQAGGGGRNTAAASGGGRRQQPRQQQQQQQGRKQGAKGGAKRRPAGGSGGGNCPGGDVASCVAACEEVARVEAFTVCVKTCGSRC